VKSGINMVYGEDVRGSVTIHLDKVSFQDALNIILRLTGLSYDYIAPNVMRIATPAMVKSEQALGVTQTGVFGVNYAKAGELLPLLSSLMSAQGKIQADNRTNSVIVTDISDNIKKVVDMIKILDVPTPQVMIEAQIVSVNKDAFKELGITWNLTKTWTDTGRNPKQDTDSGTDNVTGKQGSVSTANIGLAPGLISLGKVSNKAGEWTNLTATLGALETKGKGKVLSSPKIATLNNQEASILSGKKVAYVSSSNVSSGGATQTVNFIDVGVKLTVTPSINLDKKITMKIHAEVSSIGNVPPGTTVPPPISTRTADTNILASDGETLVIGGLIDEQATEDLSRIPFIGEIPIIGALFTHKTSNTTKTELLVFITPHIM
jgi:type IV pilus assembly protein PilQ